MERPIIEEPGNDPPKKNVEETTSGNGASYEKMSPDERRLELEKIVENNKGKMQLREYYGSGYVQFSIVGEKADKPEIPINAIQEEVARRFILEILGNLHSVGQFPEEHIPADKWNATITDSPETIIAHLSKNYSQYVNAFIFGAESAAQQYLDRVFPLIAQEYKIHLMPKRKDVPQVVQRLMYALNLIKDLRDAVSAFKLDVTERAETDETFPEIAIYTKQEIGAYRTALKNIVQMMQIVNSTGSGEVPRRNSQINQLVTVAQSGGDFKKVLATLGLLDKYFSEESNYAFARPEKLQS